MKINDPSKRLNKFWGKVDRKHIESIAQFVEGKKILDLGAGYGTTTNFLADRGYDVTAIDLDEESIKIAKTINPKINYRKLNVEQLPFDDLSFDTLILRDAIHHFLGEADITKVKKEMNRVLKPGGRLIFFDPNINFIIKILRRLSNHKDEECRFEEGLGIMDEMGYHIIHKSFNTVYSLPLSGGYVGLNLIPDIKWVQSFILKSETNIEKLIQNKIGRQIAWRYLIVGEKKIN